MKKSPTQHAFFFNFFSRSKPSSPVVRLIRCLFLSGVVAFLGWPTQGFSWDVFPTTNKIDNPKKPYTYLTVRADDNQHAIPIEVYGAERLIDKEGKETLRRVEAPFFIYPSQFMLKPQQTQRVRIQWKGDWKQLKQEKAYRIIIDGAPVEIPRQEVKKGVSVGLNILKTFITSLYVAPKEASPSLKIVGRSIETIDDKKHLALTFLNEGNAHLTFFGPQIALYDNKTTYQFNADELKQAIGTVIILAGQERRCLIPCPDDIPAQLALDEAKVSLKLPRVR